MSRVVIISRGMRSSVVAVLLDDECRIVAVKSTFHSRSGREWVDVTFPISMLELVEDGARTELHFARNGRSLPVCGTESARCFEGRDRHFFLLDRGLGWPFPSTPPTAESKQESLLDTADAERRADEREMVHESEMMAVRLRGRR